MELSTPTESPTTINLDHTETQCDQDPTTLSESVMESEGHNDLLQLVHGKGGGKTQRNIKKNAASVNLLEGTLLGKLDKGVSSPRKTKSHHGGSQMKFDSDTNKEGKQQQQPQFPGLAIKLGESVPDNSVKGYSTSRLPHIRGQQISPSAGTPYFSEAKSRYTADREGDHSNEPRREEREVAIELTAVDRALEVVNKIRQKQRADLLNGVPMGFLFGQYPTKSQSNKDGKKQKTKQKMKERPESKSSLVSSVTEGMGETQGESKSTYVNSNSGKLMQFSKFKGPQIPGWYVFPKAKDFIPRDTEFKVGENSPSCKWLLTKPGAGDRMCMVSRQSMLSRQRSYYPVSEGLQRAGTSVSQIKGTVPRVVVSTPSSTIWKRKIQVLK